MLNYLVVFCQNNNLNILRVLCLCIVAFVGVIILATLLNKKVKLISAGLVFVARVIMFFTKVFLWLWLVTGLVVILSKILVF